VWRRSDPLESKPERVRTGRECSWRKGIWGVVTEAECVYMCVCRESGHPWGGSEAECVCVCRVCVCIGVVIRGVVG